MSQKNYAQSENVSDPVYIMINEKNTTDQTVIDLVKQASFLASADLESSFIFLVDETVPFDNPPDWFTQLANSLTVAYFWNLQNGDKDSLQNMQKKIEYVKDTRYGVAKAITRS